MKTPLILTLLLFLTGSYGRGEDSSLSMVAHDEADHLHYNLGWLEGTGREISFGEWRFFVDDRGTKGGAGACLVSVGENSNLLTFSKSRAFSLFANGAGNPEVVAQRSFQGKVWVQDVFSFCMHLERLGGGAGLVEGGMGVILSSLTGKPEADYFNRGIVLEFGAYGESQNYLLKDGDGTHDTGVEVKKGPISVSFEFLSEGKYRSQIAVLGKSIDDILEVIDIPVRQLRGVRECSQIRSMAFFNRSGGLNDLFFNDIVLDRHVQQ